MAFETNVSLSSREQMIFNLMKQERSATLTRITVFLRNAEEKATITENSVLGTVKYLSAKVPALGYVIQRTSGIGRGKKAVFQMRRI